jgi:AraC-like DNA-binding protein
LRVRENAHTFPEGRYHVCHAGLVEWVIPIYDNLQLQWVIFAGPRSPGPDLRSAHREALTRWQKPPWNPKTHPIPPVDEAEAELILEHLRQLGARLHAWARQKKPSSPRKKPPAPAPGNLLLRRRTLIRGYIESRRTEPIRLKDLSALLNVSEDRATHVVRECCGQTFRDMLIDARLKAAQELLRLSALPVLEVALCSGFNAISHFNRLFRRRAGLTPGQYRRQALASFENPR